MIITNPQSTKIKKTKSVPPVHIQQEDNLQSETESTESGESGESSESTGSTIHRYILARQRKHLLRGEANNINLSQHGRNL